MNSLLNIDFETPQNEEHVFKNTQDFKVFHSNNNSLNIISQNIRSIRKNFDNFTVLLQDLDFHFDIIILSECWIDDTYTDIDLHGYSTFHTNIKLNQNDGIVIFVADLLTPFISEINLTEANCIKISLGSDLSIFAIYRPPCFKNLTPFLNSLQKLLDVNKNTQQLILAGDLNINLLNSNPKTNEYLSLLSHYGLKSTINSATRTSLDSNTCIDHIFAKTKKITISSTIHSTVTDHYSTSLGIRTNIEKKTKMPANTTHNVIDFKSLSKEISHESWTTTLKEKDPNKALNAFLSTLEIYTTKHTTLKTHKNNTHITSKIKPWITAGLVKSIHKRNMMHMRVNKNPHDTKLHHDYLLYRNLCNKLIKQAKYKFYRNEIENARMDPKKIWKVINNVAYLKPKKSHNINKISINGEIIERKNEPYKLANYINSHFSKVGLDLANKILTNNHTTEQLISKHNSTKQPIHSFNIYKLNKKEISELILSLKPQCAPGPDKISNQILINLREYIATPLLHIFNQSFSQGIVPDELKIAIITPIHKSGDKTSISNYRPISLLNSISKVLEKAMKKRLTSYLDKHNLLSGCQFGFRAKMSTEQAISELTNYIVKNTDKGSKVIGVFLDLAKAFDTISHDLLYEKLKNNGINGPPLNWFISYTKNRKQIVELNNCYSDPEEIKYGVPQGSVLGPLLFLIYINELTDIKMASIDYKVISYADDTVILFTGLSWEKAFKSAETGMLAIKNWLDKNLLTLNISKTKYLTFSKTISGQPKTFLPLYLHPCTTSKPSNHNCEKIEHTDNIKYLGLTVDYKLKWEPHINLLIKKIRKLSFIFKTIRNIMSLKQLKNVYYALCQSLLTYGISAWGGAADKYIKPLNTTHKTLIRIMLKKPYLHPTENLLITHKILDIRKLYIKKIIHNNCIKSSPCHITHPQNTRAKSHNQFQVPTIKSTFAKKHESYLAPLIFNTFLKETTYSINQKNLKWLYKQCNIWLLHKKREYINKLMLISS